MCLERFDRAKVELLLDGLRLRGRHFDRCVVRGGNDFRLRGRSRRRRARRSRHVRGSVRQRFDTTTADRRTHDHALGIKRAANNVFEPKLIETMFVVENRNF